MIEHVSSCRREHPQGKSSCYIRFVVVSIFIWVKQIWYDLLVFTRNKQGKPEIKQKSFEKNINNRNTGYPAQDPTANKYLSGSGWEIKFFCFLFSPETNREPHKNNRKASSKNMKKHRNTGYPAQDLTANKYHIFTRGGSWAGYPVFMFFWKLFVFLMFFLFKCFRLVYLSFCIYNRTTHI